MYVTGASIIGHQFGGTSADDIVDAITAGIPAAVIPVPAAGWLMIVGVGALGAMRHRRAA